ncbi:MAG TPA: hypothetical protein DDW65_10515 [Firmicutes bacterium]|jgi:hypothetical protein|nr:hypothetical protein [Bacillota bacterium]
MSEEIKNIIQYITNKDLVSIKMKLKSNDKIHIVELDGTYIKSWEDYICEIQNRFKFPTSCLDSVDRYLDWMRDLEWLDKEEFVLIINHFNDFCNDNPKIKEEIISDYENVILPFWQDEVKNVVVDGKAKHFLVYLVG